MHLYSSMFSRIQNGFAICKYSLLSVNILWVIHANMNLTEYMLNHDISGLVLFQPCLKENSYMELQILQDR